VLHFDPEVSNDDFVSGLVESKFENINQITINQLTAFNGITNIDFKNWIITFKNLKVLKLQECYDFVNNNTMQSIFEHLVNLEEFECVCATKVSNIGFLGRGKQSNFQITRLYNLRRACFWGTELMNDIMLETITNHTLQYLDLSCCPNITTEGVKALLQQLPSLEVLKLQFNEQITRRILNYVANYKQCAPRLKDIIFDRSDQCCCCGPND
jgi:Leucine Rich repeat